MKIIESISDMQAWSSAKRREGKTIAFVPTMGALHGGHLSLVQIAKENANCVVASIFVNPIQFGKKEDFQKYPSTIVADLRNLTQQGIDVVFMPTKQIMYPKGFQSSVNVGALTKHLCGRSRPEHFEGVTTVVAKLFHAVKPDVAIFGNKDFQQRVVIEKMVQDLNMDIEIMGAPIVREFDGLAMSSRNRYLTASERTQVLVLYKALKRAESLFLKGERKSKRIIQVVSEMIDKERPQNVDYIKICDVKTLEEIIHIEDKALLALAVQFDGARLVDNVVLDTRNQNSQNEAY